MSAPNAARLAEEGTETKKKERLRHISSHLSLAFVPIVAFFLRPVVLPLTHVRLAIYYARFFLITAFSPFPF